MRPRSATCVAMLPLLAAAGASAQSERAPAVDALRKQVRAVRFHSHTPRLDGRLDDTVWQQAQFVADFLQREPVEGAPPSAATEVGFLYDDAALYVGARMHGDDPAAIRRLVGRRDQPGNTERIIVSLDTYCDRRTACSFAVSATGVRSDYYHPADEEFWREFSWNPVWEARAAIDSTGWTAEMRIPFSQLRFNDTPQQIWGVNLNRWVPSRNEDDFWIYVPRRSTGWASHFGDLVGIEGIRPSRRLELLPYVASDARFFEADTGDPFRDGSELDGRVGADLKMGLGPNFTLDATVNPDFGQVEADPAVVNLSAFETYFDERRPFFVEGGQLLRGDGPNYFYSRRIGAPPPGEVDGDFTDIPRTSTILAAGKVTGRLASGLSLGTLAALTDREHAGAADGGSLDRVKVGVRTGYGVLRLQQEIGAARSTVGLSLTAVSRDLSAGDALAGQLARHAYTGGSDWLLRFRGGEYEVRGSAGFSWIEGSASAIREVQTSSAHYFERPDAGHVSLDTTRTSLAGWTANLSVERRRGTHWLWGGGVGIESPDFELNDSGRLQSADDIENWAVLRYRDTTPGRIFYDYEVRLIAGNDFNFGGVRKRTDVDLEAGCVWKNFLRSSAVVGYGLGGLSDDHTRGGPLFRTAADWNFDLEVESNWAATTQWSLEGGYWFDEIDAWSTWVEGRIGGRLGDRWELSVAPGWDRGTTARQYVAALPSGQAATFGTRYVFAKLDRSTLLARFRLAYAFTPDLTLEGYAEPFASTGRFDDFGELRAARTSALRLYGTEGTTIARDANDDLTITDGADTFSVSHDDYRGDFETLSFRSNLVLRWEWRPGSTLFLIWQQNRSQDERTRRLVRPGDLLDALAAEGDDFVAVKAAYWFPVD